MGIKSRIYKFLRIWNDYDAIRKGRVKQRLGRRILGRIAGKGIGRLIK